LNRLWIISEVTGLLFLDILAKNQQISMKTAFILTKSVGRNVVQNLPHWVSSDNKASNLRSYVHPSWFIVIVYLCTYGLCG
jgi:hypothetical protein